MAVAVAVAVAVRLTVLVEDNLEVEKQTADRALQPSCKCLVIVVVSEEEDRGVTDGISVGHEPLARHHPASFFDFLAWLFLKIM